ncbi:hypothetical protein FSB08_26260 [Paraburkholderia sp. JPY432]|uniref:hypothetical protein n=1 Tax=Paraburkholderia youngii TaxID=2782701 RepID=UPI001595B5A7|nr:hypothetical protein [Paraburkholderia youngii]NVH75941.1 hypothetical protein [Paraburkholderia youngii]
MPANDMQFRPARQPLCELRLNAVASAKSRQGAFDTGAEGGVNPPLIRHGSNDGQHGTFEQKHGAVILFIAKKPWRRTRVLKLVLHEGNAMGV